MPSPKASANFPAPPRVSDKIATMRVISVNVGRVRETEWNEKMFRTAIFKEPVGGRVLVAADGLVGDEQANTENHGGKLKALLAYAHEHYNEFWRDSLPGTPLPHGSFGRISRRKTGWMIVSILAIRIESAQLW